MHRDVDLELRDAYSRTEAGTLRAGVWSRSRRTEIGSIGAVVVVNNFIGLKEGLQVAWLFLERAHR